MKRTYGLDDYSRYVTVDGERYVIEPWPIQLGWRYRLNLLKRAQARWDILRWFWGTRHSPGLWKY